VWRQIGARASAGRRVETRRGVFRPARWPADSSPPAARLRRGLKSSKTGCPGPGHRHQSHTADRRTHPAHSDATPHYATRWLCTGRSFNPSQRLAATRTRRPPVCLVPEHVLGYDARCFVAPGSVNAFGKQFPSGDGGAGGRRKSLLWQRSCTPPAAGSPTLPPLRQPRRLMGPPRIRVPALSARRRCGSRT